MLLVDLKSCQDFESSPEGFLEKGTKVHWFPHAEVPKQILEVFILFWGASVIDNPIKKASTPAHCKVQSWCQPFDTRVYSWIPRVGTCALLGVDNVQ